MKKLTTEQFIAKAREVHGDKYDYSIVKYVGVHQKVTIVCPEHGLFKQTPAKHLKGRGCKQCGTAAQTSTTEQFIAKARETHGCSKYDYSMVEYVNARQKVTIVCPEHGAFVLTPANHLQGRGCKQCGITLRAAVLASTTERFIEKARACHGKKYNYQFVVYTHARQKVKIVCPEHGAFVQTPTNHLQGRGCKQCCDAALTSTTAQFIVKAQTRHGDKYAYSLVAYTSSRHKVAILCPDHGVFEQRPDDHLMGKSCPRCANVGPSQPEQEMFEYTLSLCPDAEQSNREIIRSAQGRPLELDVYVPSQRVAIEMNGVYWHCGDDNKHKHAHKYQACKAAGIRLIQFTDIDWQDKQDICKRIIQNAVGQYTGAKLNARDCTVRELQYAEAASFLDKWHIQGAATARHYYGLQHPAAGLVAVMQFSYGRHGYCELSRFAASCSVRGGGSKLLQHAIKQIQPVGKIVSFSANDIFEGGMYKALGFRLDGEVGADYHVWHPKLGLRHKSSFARKNIPARLLDLGLDESFDPDTDPRSEATMTTLMGCERLHDSGKKRWVLDI